MAQDTRPRPASAFDHFQRASDLLLVVAAASVWAPLLVLGLVLTYLESGRPLFFGQTRMGRWKRPFVMYKIRTMSANVTAPEGVLHAGWTYQKDPRVTRVGRFLRAYRIDELPQVLNILRGEMSIVGPRPEPWEVAESLGEQIPGYHERHEVLPGITGLCQISPLYLDFGTVAKSANKLTLDLQWVRGRSPAMYLEVLRRTLPVVIGGRGVK